MWYIQHFISLLLSLKPEHRILKLAFNAYLVLSEHVISTFCTVSTSGSTKTVKNLQTTKGCSRIAVYACRMEHGRDGATNSSIFTAGALEVRTVWIRRRTPKSSQGSLSEPASKITDFKPSIPWTTAFFMHYILEWETGFYIFSSITCSFIKPGGMAWLNKIFFSANNTDISSGLICDSRLFQLRSPWGGFAFSCCITSCLLNHLMFAMTNAKDLTAFYQLEWQSEIPYLWWKCTSN